MTKGEIAREYFLSGKNCAQSVALAFMDELKLDKTTIEKMTIGFGGGLARQRLTCGVVAGMAFVLGYLFEEKGKTAVYQIIQKACEMFKNETGSLICEELLSGITADNSPVPSERTDEYYKKRPCQELCLLGVDIVANILGE